MSASRLFAMGVVQRAFGAEIFAEMRRSGTGAGDKHIGQINTDHLVGLHLGIQQPDLRMCLGLEAREALRSGMTTEGLLDGLPHELECFHRQQEVAEPGQVTGVAGDHE